jgi:hypothetical protein
VKKLIKIFFVFIAVLISSCNDDFLSEDSKGLYTTELVWSDPNLVEMVVNDMYRGYGYAFSYIQLSSLVDEAHMTDDRGTNNFINSVISPDNIPIITGEMFHQEDWSWNLLYKHIRECNLFFEKFKDIPDNKIIIDGKTKVQRMKGEAFFWRGQFYFLLTNLWGGVPLVLRSYELEDDFEIPRSSYEDCINRIISDLDSAMYNLPISYSTDDEIGRVTKGAALALKARVLMYAASDLHNPKKNIEITSGYSHPEYLGYTGGDENARWNAAKNAAKAVIDMNHYALYKSDPVAGEESKNYQNIFLEQKLTSEDIFVRFFKKNINEGWPDYRGAVFNSSVGYGGWGGNTPLEEQVSSYEMKDGSKFDWNNPGNSTNPYINRDPRLEASVFYEGSTWRMRPSGFQFIDPFNKIQVGAVGYMSGGNFIYKMSGGSKIVGLDSRENEGTYTGYYMKKFLDPSISAMEWPANQQINPWRYIRYAEVLLNYAEACIELGQESEAKTYINMIRKRVGMPGITDSGATLKERYRNERRVELAFEEHRFFDVRRWMIAPKAYSGGYGVQVRYIVPEDANITSYKKDDGSTWTEPIYTKIPLPLARQRTWNNKAYFLPFSAANEMLKNKKLIQNPGY